MTLLVKEGLKRRGSPEETGWAHNRKMNRNETLQKRKGTKKLKKLYNANKHTVEHLKSNKVNYQMI